MLTSAQTAEVTDFWVNVVSAKRAEELRASGHLAVPIGEVPADPASLLRMMDNAGIARAVLAAPLLDERGGPSTLLSDWCKEAPDRFRAGPVLDDLSDIVASSDAVEASAQSGSLAVLRIVPMMVTEPINSRRLYPVYERCASLGIPVSVNAGMPGPKARASLQEPILLDDVLFDFPDLVVVAAHMGNPWEDVLIALMRKYIHLYLATSAYLTTYISEQVLQFMRTSVGDSRVIFGSDWPVLPLERAVNAAKAIDLPGPARSAFLDTNLRDLLHW